MAARIPPAYLRVGRAVYSGAYPVRGVPYRRIMVTPVESYTRQVTTDIGNDGVAPLAQFGSGGTAYAFAGPQDGLGGSWSLDQCYASTSVGALDASQVTFYVGPYMGPGNAVLQYAVTNALSGGGAQVGMGGLGIAKGWFVQCYWTGGTSGAFAQLRVTGSKTVQAAWPQVAGG